VSCPKNSSFLKHQKLDIQSVFYEPNAFYFPWRMNLDGIISSDPDIRINRFLERVYPGFLESKNKVKVQHTVVKRLYQNSF